MKHFLVVVLILGLTNAWIVTAAPKKSTLKLVHVVFRHGNRNPEESSIWEGNKYKDEKYYPEGYGQLTNEGKRTEYKLGQILRERYDDFLGDIWNINYVDFRSTNYNRTKMSGLLVMAGLWPPKGSNIWNPLLPWQPIPFNYVPASEDDLLFPIYSSEFATAYAEVVNSDEFNNYITERYGEALKILSENTGSEVSFSTASSYWDAIKVQIQLGYPQEEWVKQVYPDPLDSLGLDTYYAFTNTTTLRRILAGNFIKKVLTDSKSAANGTLSPSTRKLFVYSAHDLNVGSIILSLEAYKIPKAPPYGSGILFEVHEINGVWGLKLFYIDDAAGSPHPAAIPGCNHFCPLDQFEELVQEILPQ